MLTGRDAGAPPSSPGRGALRIKSAGKVYEPDGAPVVALEDVSLDIPAGEFCVVAGPSGCGKTTLLNAIAGFERLTSGEIAMDGEVLATPGRAPAPGADRMVVFQHGALFPWKTVLWNVTCGPVLQGRLPRVLLLDEPFRALDALTKSVMHECLLELYDLTRKTIVFITHDLEEAVFLADRVIVMTTRPGRVKKVIAVDLPRPRDHRILVRPAFLARKQEAIEAIYEEAVKAFAAGERELA